jgi:hypothetical protein
MPSINFTKAVQVSADLAALRAQVAQQARVSAYVAAQAAIPGGVNPQACQAAIAAADAAFTAAFNASVALQSADKVAIANTQANLFPGSFPDVVSAQAAVNTASGAGNWLQNLQAKTTVQIAALIASGQYAAMIQSCPFGAYPPDTTVPLPNNTSLDPITAAHLTRLSAISVTP